MRPNFFIVVTMFSLMFVGSAFALSLGRAESIQKMNRFSAAVAHVRIESAEDQIVHGVECGTRYTTAVLDKFKFESGGNGARTLKFGRFKGLLPEREYILFFNNIEDLADSIFSIHLGVRSELPNGGLDPDQLDVVRCNGLFPSLQYSLSYVWEVQDEDRVVVTNSPRQWPPTVRIIRGSVERSRKIVRRSDLFKYLHDIQDWVPPFKWPEP